MVVEAVTSQRMRSASLTGKHAKFIAFREGWIGRVHWFDLREYIGRRFNSTSDIVNVFLSLFKWFAVNFSSQNIYKLKHYILNPRIPQIFLPIPPHVPYGLRGSPPGCGRSVTDFWGWDAHQAQLRCADEVDGDILIWSTGRGLKPKLYWTTQTMVTIGIFPFKGKFPL
jgi:hypothetical protein